MTNINSANTNEVQYHGSHGSINSFLQATLSKRLQGHSLRFMIRNDGLASENNMHIHCGARMIDEALLS